MKLLKELFIMSEETLAPSILSFALNLTMYLTPDHREHVTHYVEDLRQKYGEKFATAVFQKAKEIKQSPKKVASS